MAFQPPGIMPSLNSYVIPPPQIFVQPVLPTAIPQYTPLLQPSLMNNIPPIPLPPLERLPVPFSHKSLNPTTTVFVGNIHENAPDLMMRNILAKIGNIVSWKRVQGLNGKLQAFGFCEFDDPEATLRAIRLLHNLEIGGKKLLVKVDAKSKDKLWDYKINKKRESSMGGNQSMDDFGMNIHKAEDDEEFYNDDLFKLDVNAVKRDNNIVYEIKKLLKENAHEFLKTEEDELTMTKDKLSRQKLAHGPLDEEKTEVISKEILRFKENNMRDEKYREKIREKRERERTHGRKSSPQLIHDRSDLDEDRHRKRHRLSRSTSRGSRKGTRKHKSPEKESQPRDDSQERKEREERREREEKEKAKRLEQEAKEEEEREKAYERRRLERKLREKEASYQEQLKLWEAREQKKLREHKKRKEYDEYLRKEEMSEAKKLREFLEDYIDERDDAKYYKGQFLARRLKEREKEMEMDLKDRQKEKDEIEEIKARLANEGHPNLEDEIAKLEQNRSKHLKPQLKIANGLVSSPSKKGKSNRESTPDHTIPSHHKKERKKHKKSESTHENSNKSSEVITVAVSMPQLTTNSFVEIVDTVDSIHKTSGVLLNEQVQQHPPPKSERRDDHLCLPNDTETVPLPPSADDLLSTTQPAPPGYKPIGLKPMHFENKTNALFNAEEDEDKQKIKLSTLDDGTSVDAKKTGESLEDKRQAIKKLIEKIPTNKAKLFEYDIEWDMVDNVLMEKRIKPWINKKIIEYIGEEEPTLVDFICSKLLNRNEPQSILDDILMVLDEEAEVFIVKLWRLLIYEIEAKKAGVLKAVE